ncbi:MAG: YchJ family protein [Rhodospirillaceae bacterium]
MSVCPCGSDRSFDTCCGPCLEGTAVAPTAEALMRSRYSAFVKGNVDYLEQTLLPESRDDFDRAQATQWAENSQWNALEILSTERGGPDDTDGVVEFIARFRMNEREHAHHETSTFTRRDGRWWYVDGKVGQKPRTVVKIGRNDPCSCDSGKKYKKCCGAATL